MLLASAELSLEDSAGGVRRCRALIDPGSEVNLITSSLARQLSVPLRENHVSLRVIGGSSTCDVRQSTVLRLQTRESTGPTLQFPASLLSNLGITTPRFKGTRESWPHLEGLRLADPYFLCPRKIEVLLGAEVYAQILRDGLRHGPPGTPTAQNTSVGWIIFGAINSQPRDHPRVLSTSCSPLESLDRTLKKFWETEEIVHTQTSLCGRP